MNSAKNTSRGFVDILSNLKGAPANENHGSATGKMAKLSLPSWVVV